MIHNPTPETIRQKERIIYEMTELMKDNPEMTKEKLDKEMNQFEKLGIIDVGDALTKGIGAMDMNRVKAFHKLAIDSGIIEKGSVDISKVATDQFVNKGHGLDIKAKLK